MKRTTKWTIKLGLAMMLLPATLNIGTDSASANTKAKQSVSAVVQKGKTATIKVHSLNMRASASFSAKVVGIATKGKTYTILKTSNGLHQVGPNKWISANAKYVKVSSSSVKAKPTTTSKPKETKVNNSSKANTVVQVAKKTLGVPYKWGGTTTKGFDCSGFVSYVYKKAGYNISRMDTATFRKKATKVSSPKAGDLVFLQNTYKKGVSHIGIYIGSGKMIHAGSKGVETVSLSNSYYKKHFLGYGRL